MIVYPAVVVSALYLSIAAMDTFIMKKLFGSEPIPKRRPIIYEKRCMIWVKDGDDPEALRVAVQLSSMPLDTISLKNAILDDPTLSDLYNSTESFNLYHAGIQLTDDAFISDLSFNDTVECKLILPEVYRINIHRESRKSFRQQAFHRNITVIELGTFQRINQVHTQHSSFIQLAVPSGRGSAEIERIEILNDNFSGDLRFYKYDNASDSFDKYTFEPQNLFQIEFEIKSSKTDGIYWHSEYECTESFHRFVKVDKESNSFIVRKDIAMNRIIDGKASTHLQLLIPLARSTAVYPYRQRMQQTISFKKLTDF